MALFQWTAVESATEAIGRWELRGQELLLCWEGVAEPERTYWVIEPPEIRYCCAG